LIALELPDHVTAQCEDGMQVLSFQNIAHGIFADRADAVAQRALTAFALDAMQGAELAGTAQENSF
jgi:hypothetical protein